MPASTHSSASANQAANNGTEGQGLKTTKSAMDPVRAEAMAERLQGHQGGQDGANLRDQLTDAVERINEMMQNGKQTLKFQLDDDSGRMVVQVMDARTDEVIRQIPSEETLKFAEYVDGLVGLIFNKKA